MTIDRPVVRSPTTKRSGGLMPWSGCRYWTGIWRHRPYPRPMGIATSWPLGGLESECDTMGRRRLDAPGATARLAGMDRSRGHLFRVERFRLAICRRAPGRVRRHHQSGERRRSDQKGAVLAVRHQHRHHPDIDIAQHLQRVGNPRWHSNFQQQQDLFGHSDCLRNCDDVRRGRHHWHFGGNRHLWDRRWRQHDRHHQNLEPRHWWRVRIDHGRQHRFGNGRGWRHY